MFWPVGNQACWLAAAARRRADGGRCAAADSPEARIVPAAPSLPPRPARKQLRCRLSRGFTAASLRSLSRPRFLSSTALRVALRALRRHWLRYQDDPFT